MRDPSTIIDAGHTLDTRAVEACMILQRKCRGKWKWIDRARLNRKSKFLLDLPSCRARYGITWPNQNARNQPNRRVFRP